MTETFFNSIAEKWIKEFENAFEANVDSRQKFLVTVAFPYTNSPFHIGHGRTYVTADIYARYMRMKGFNVLFPLGFQFTGTPILSISEALKRGDKDIVKEFLEIYRIPQEKLKELEDPLKLAEYFREDMKKTAKRFGLSIDWRREFTTVDKSFEKFVQWQLKTLRNKGYLVTSTEAVGYCPNDGFPVGMHDTRGDVEPEIVSEDVILFEDGELVFPVVTSRPETVFGATAIMINPESEYVLAIKDNRKWVVSKEAYDRLKYQVTFRGVEEIDKAKLLSASPMNPVTRERLKVIESKYVEPKVGTGVVMAVPAHEPLHFLRYLEEGEEIRPRIVIISSEYKGIPAEEVISLAGTKNPSELKDYIETLYRTEYYKGVMASDLEDHVPDYLKQFVKEEISGRPVKDARGKVIELLKKINAHDTIYEISNAPVYCRCGAEIVVKVIPSQLFINYEDPAWKSIALKSLDKIRFVPKDVRSDFEKVIFSMGKRACSRSRGLGARIPWDESQIVDSLSDSTIYTAFYTISHLLPKDSERLDDDFWNYVLLGEGDKSFIAKKTGISEELLTKMREEFEYWYPVDSRHSGRDLVRNHLPYYIYNHVAIFGEKYLPRLIVVNGFVRVGGKKMSKSFGNVYPLEKAMDEYGPDPVRLALATSSEISEDVDFRQDVLNSVYLQLKKIYDVVSRVSSISTDNAMREEDLWFSSIVSFKIREVNRLMDSLEFRKAYNIILYELYDLFRDYIEIRERPNKDVLTKFVDAWIKLLSPGAPFTAEELWHLYHSSLVAKESFPSGDEFTVNTSALLRFEYVRFVISYVKQLEEEVNKKPEKIVIYVAKPEQLEDFRTVINAIRSHKELPESEYFLRIRNNLSKIPTLIKELALTADFDEFEAIVDNTMFMLNQLNVDEIRVYYYDDPNAPDIKGKKSYALPLLPSIVLL
ncbi:MAG: leucyl-tRNA ligase [Candidatus Aramenus sulfurataquae]|uniref:Leucine--tRNA ligase n=1 Tax=Candidatus Aramenus sulfurataquae TaxID=1326980 RepID=W7KW99_9CREN|nr:leucyl-tRNA synthetase [Candidatus Aramenus sulfurataquae]EWG07576.1 MAG: leucyl-tRNA ligase [Candidatus Aramenus sulfurataquae]